MTQTCSDGTEQGSLFHSKVQAHFCPFSPLSAHLHLAAPQVECFPSYYRLTGSFGSKYRSKDKVSLDKSFMWETSDKSSGFIPKISTGWMTSVIQHVGALQARGRKQFVTPALCCASYCSREPGKYRWGLAQSKLLQNGQDFARLQHTELSPSSRLRRQYYEGPGNHSWSTPALYSSSWDSFV